MERTPTVNVYIDETKKRKDGQVPLNIVVTYKGTRAKESCHLWMTVQDFKKGLWKKTLRKRLSEIDDRIEELLSERKPFTASDCLSKNTTKTPLKILSEMSSVKKLGDGTVRGYIIALRSLQKYFGEDFTLSDLTLHQIQGFARHTRVNPTSMCGYLKRLHSLLQFSYEKGYLKENVMDGWKFKSEGYKAVDKPRSRTRVDITIIIKFFEKGDEAAGIWLSGFYFCGLALTDLMSVDWKKVEKTFIDGGWYYHTTISRKKTREVANVVTPVFPLTEKLYSFLLTTPWEGYSVRQYSDRINRKLKKIDPTLTYYQCRHSFCSMMVGSGAPLNSIASLMGRSVNGISAYIVRISESETLAKTTSTMKGIEVLETPPEDLFD